LAAEPTGSPEQITAALQEITERAQLIVREEIELARAEVTEKISRIIKGAVVGTVAGVFGVAALTQALTGFSFLAYYVLPGRQFQFFWGFFFMAAVLLVLGVIAGLVAARFLKSGNPPTPDMAIEEGKRIRDTVKNA
jgi:Putative Actinobacterial Holin-X, holin superfamily III